MEPDEFKNMSKKMTPGLKRAAVFCIIKSGSRYLLLKRGKQPNQGKFVPVGGKIDPYEAPHDAVVREVMEETGLHISYPEFYGVLTETSPTDYNWISFIYKVEVAFIAAPLCDEGELFWIEEDELTTIETPPTDWYIYQYIAAGQKFVFNAEYNENMQLVRMRDDLRGTDTLISNEAAITSH
jgi:8-oxo-dGTP diphosphatase